MLGKYSRGRCIHFWAWISLLGYIATILVNCLHFFISARWKVFCVLAQVCDLHPACWTLGNLFSPSIVYQLCWSSCLGQYSPFADGRPFLIRDLLVKHCGIEWTVIYNSSIPPQCSKKLVRVQSFVAALPSREEPGISLSIVNSKARFDPALNSCALHTYYSEPKAW